MKIVLVTIGSRGDVQPMLALCLAFRAAGHQAVLVGPPERASWALRMDCPYVAHGSDFTTLLDSFDNVHSPIKALDFARRVRGMVARQFTSLPGVIAGADLVVGASLCFGLSSIAEAMGITYRFIAFTPQLIPSKAHPCPLFKRQDLPGWWNLFSWRLVNFFDHFNFSRMINRKRRHWGLAPLSQAWYHVLGPKLFVATDVPLAALPPDAIVPAEQTGYMRLRQPPCFLPGLRRFLEAGPPPVYAGFGSMPRADQARLIPLIKKAAEQAGQRLVLARFWKDRSELDPNGKVYYLSRYPHEQLFPEMAAIIHHGGAGTTATAAWSGVPQIIIPHVLDQFFWGHRVHVCGLGPRPIPRSALKVMPLGKAIAEAVSSPDLMVRAKEVQSKIKGAADGADATMRAVLNSI